MRVLLIDDDEIVARALERCLSTEHDVRFEKNPAHAVDQIRAGERYDAILCDVVMPRMTGQEVHDAISSVDREQARRIVFVSGRVHEVGCRIGKVTCMPKPFDLDLVRSVIARFLPIRLHSSSTSLTPVRKPTTS